MRALVQRVRKTALSVGGKPVSEIPLGLAVYLGVKEGDTVTLFGHDGDAFLPVDELAGYNHTISYELVCLLSKRVPRIYYRGGEAVAELDYLCSGNGR